MKIELPLPEVWARSLSDLFGRPFVVQRGPMWVPSRPAIAAGIYASDVPGAPPQAIWLLDLEAAASLAGALSMLPPAVAEESIRAGQLSEALLENFHEVMNVGAGMIKVTEGRIKLTHVFTPPQIPPELAREWLQTARQRVELSGGLQGLATGHMYLLSTT